MQQPQIDDKEWLRELRDDIKLAFDRLRDLSQRVASLEEQAKQVTARAGKARPQEEGEVWTYMESLPDSARPLEKGDAIWFLDKMEASGWRNNGKPVASWKATIRVWAREGYFPSQKRQSGCNGQPGASVGTLQRVLEDKRQAAKAFRNMHSHDTGLGTEWDHKGNWNQYKDMMCEVKALELRLSQQLGL